MDNLSLPENRTEETQQALLHWLEATTHTESHCIGTQPDENGVEREVWQHTMTPEHIDLNELIHSKPTTTTGTLNLADIEVLFEQMFANAVDDPNTIRISPRKMHQIRRMFAQGKRYERARKRTRRQRRAAQRRRNRGRS